MKRGALLVFLLLTACEGRPFDAYRGVVDFSELPPGTFPEGGGLGVTGPATIAPVLGFHRSRLVELYDLGVHLPEAGAVHAVVHDMWVFVDADGRPLHSVLVEPDRSGARLVGQAPVVDILPHHHDRAYSPFFEIVRVRLEGTVDPGEIEALASGRPPLRACRPLEVSPRCRPDFERIDPHVSEDCGGDPCVQGFCRRACDSDAVCAGGGQTCRTVRFTEGARAGTEQRLCMEPDCLRPEDCEDGFECVGDLCRPLVSPDCAEGERCIEGRCLPPCTRSDDCALGQTCDRGSCTEYECDIDSQCEGSQVCLDGICRPPVTVGGYRLDDVKSIATIRNAGYDLERTGEIVHCPIVDSGTTIEPGLSARDRVYPRVPLWYRGMRTWCLLLDGGEALVPGGADVIAISATAGDPPAIDPGEALLLGASVGEGFVQVDVAPWILEGASGAGGGFAPFVRVRRVEVGPDHAFGGIDSTDAVDPSLVSPFEPERFHAVSVRGAIPACATNADCADTGLAELPEGCSDVPGAEAEPCRLKALEPLTCNPELEPVVPADPARPGFCDLPPVGVGAACGSGRGRCDPEGGVTGSGLVCLWVFEESFCYEGCNNDLVDEDPDPARDSRCNAVDGYRCFRLVTDEQPNGVCIRLCQTGSDPVGACESPTCGNGTVEVGEACDFDPEEGEVDTCNETCSIDGSAADPPVEAPVDDHPLQCQFGFCIYPDERAR